MNIGDKIKHLRKEKGLTQQELAIRCELSKNAIWNYENNKRNPNIETLTKIAQALGVDINKLCNYEKNNSIGEKIKEYRKLSKLTQEQLAKIAGISASYLQQLELEQKGNPSIETLTKIAKALNIPISKIMGENPKEIDLSSIQTKDLIEELNKRTDFEITLEVK
ncbi:helix-turn-helix domain-containing protein [Hathewaya massiliensis]|uniref:helix-turn-helix domain-containing protein n=1 Tax=Hathewaya massiliensis TaxID=1964382 RepID=UPI00115BCC30|nr:helix-turn-helix transcriptional regulator [Hathewaya massiliensis]